MALLMVLLLLSLTLGLSYAAMRGQSTGGMIQRNADRRASARQAAMTGLTLAIKKMHRSDWGGVDTSMAASLGGNDSFLATYATGDPRISANDADQPYRVTILSTGYSSDPEQPQAVAIYRVRAVLRLIPRNLAAEPSRWSTMINYTVYQTHYGDFNVTAPARIEGSARLQCILNLDDAYAWLGSPRDAYHRDLEAMRVAGLGDYRPFDAQVSLPRWWQAPETIASLESDLGLSTRDVSTAVLRPPFPSTLATYRLYPGGKAYTVPQLPQTIQGSVYQPDPATNPAGLFFRAGSLTVGDDATIRGTIVTPAGGGGRIQITGKRVRLDAFNLPPLFGTTEPVQLPVAMSGEDIQVVSGAEVTITGLAAAYGTFEAVADQYANMAVALQGRLIASGVVLTGGLDWTKSVTWWNSRYGLFNMQKYFSTGIKYFPEWLRKTQGLDYRPRITMKPETSPVRYHWHNPQNTIYVPDATDEGLRWDLLDWSENL